MEEMKAFFVDLYHKFINLSWVAWTIDYCKENAVMAGIIGGLVLLIILLLCIMGGMRKKAKKAKNVAVTESSQPAQTEIAEKAAPAPAPAPAPAAAPTPTPNAEEKVTPKVEPKAEIKVAPKMEKTPTPVATPSPIAEEVKPEPVKPAPVEVKPEPVKPAPVEEKKTTPIVEKKVEQVVVEKKVEKVIPVATPVEDAEIVEENEMELTKQAKDVEETFEMVENIDENIPEQLRDNYDEDETDRIAKYKGKWTICRVVTNVENHEEMYFFELRASNGEKLLSSEEYTSYQGALRGIQTHKSNILKGNLKIARTKKGDYLFRLLSGKNMLLCMGENYPTKERCESAMQSTIRFAETAVIDENVQDIVLKVPKEDDTPVPPIPENSNGKWIITSDISAEGETVYFFELLANNGEKLLSSEEYTTYIGAVNGIQTHKTNIAKNNFRISLTKRGDYIYKLLNGNGQLLCLGEHYRTKRLCQNAVDSVKRFALSSPVLTDVEQN